MVSTVSKPATVMEDPFVILYLEHVCVLMVTMVMDVGKVCIE